MCRHILLKIPNMKYRENLFVEICAVACVQTYRQVTRQVAALLTLWVN